MKKRAKTKNEMLDLVAAMAKLVERLEVLEKKTDSLTGRVGSLPSEIKQYLQNLRPGPKEHHLPAPHAGSSQAPREKILYEVVCSDCFKNCKVPFKPSENRPVYCPECFAIRKAGHVPQDPTQRVKPMHPPKQIVPLVHKKAKPLSPSKRAASPKKKKSAKRSKK
ncbi:MAG TPA: hypothetical protein P5561_01215 [Candidatus Omnitrophota bacterium]|nr:hypothetical protein [Candidatus Omnitrophota bacterium]HRY85133.1 hypothetical protein [Candidatus Omnitrophota bacterium]